MSKYTIYFGGSLPGEPGPGDWTDIDPKEFDYIGNDPEGEAKRLQMESYNNQGILCDLRYWFEKIPDNNFILISGPSGVGKGMIIDNLLKLSFPEFFPKEDRYRKDVKDLCIVPVYKSQIGGGGSAGASVYGKSNGKNVFEFDCRGIKQEINLDELDEAILHDTVLMESYHTTRDFLKNRYNSNTNFQSVFISPLNLEELEELYAKGIKLEDYLPDLMLDSLVKRAEREGKTFTRTLIKDLEKRAEDSVVEMKDARNYDFIIPNHCYESDSRWKLPFLIGEPKLVVDSLYNIYDRYSSKYSFEGKDIKFV